MRQRIQSLLIIGVLFAVSTAYGAGIPVFDASNMVENKIAAVENVAQTLKQVEEFQLQITQYQNMLQNTMTLPDFNFGNIQNMMDNMIDSLTSLQDFDLNSHGQSQSGSGSGGADCNAYGDLQTYNQHPYITDGSQRAQIEQYDQATDPGFTARKKAYDELIEMLQKQKDDLQNQVDRLQDIEQGAESATGRMEAIQSSNQLLSFMAQELMQIRTLMMSQSTAEAIRQEKEMADNAKKVAARRKLHRKVDYARKWGDEGGSKKSFSASGK